MWKINELKIDPGLRSLVPKDHKIVKNMELAEDLFSSNEIVVIAVESENLISEQILNKYSSLHDSLVNIPSVSRVASIYSQKYIVPDDGGFEIQKILNKIPEDSLETSAFIEKIQASEIVGSLISAELNIMCFIAQITAPTDFDEIAFRENLFQIIDSFKGIEDIYIACLLYTSPSPRDS